MLSHLSIQNMAIIESLQLDLNKNMTVLTGETGAGKSIIIDAISLLIGDRASTDLIRHHEEMAIIEGVFEIEHNQPLKAYLLEQNIPADDQLVVKRIIKRVGNGQIRVNGELLSANQLKEIGQYLVDIHVQHDTHRLFHQEYNYQLIDNFGLTDEISLSNEAYQKALKEYNQAKQAYINFKKNAQDIQKRLDLILFQKNEIEKANLKKGELDELEQLVNIHGVSWDPRFERRITVHFTT
ncbi:MAG: AAA family ATPase, partial [Turicibacter sp.]|nr:AAA family ATPase [Turicibacter sp.]